MIDLTKPIECNGIEVNPLTGWTEGGLRYCLVDYRGTVCVMDELHGAITASKFPHVGTAINTPPKPNLVGNGDKVYLGDDPYTVIGVDGNRAWIKRHICGTRRVVMISEITLNGLPIDGVKEAR